MAFIAAPCEAQVKRGESAGMDGDAARVAMAQVAETDIVAAEAHLGFIDAEEETDGDLSEAVLKRSVDEEEVGRAETIVAVSYTHLWTG